MNIYNDNYLAARAKTVILDSIAYYDRLPLAEAKEEEKEFAGMALSDAERQGCDDLVFLDFLYLNSTN